MDFDRGSSFGSLGGNWLMHVLLFMIPRSGSLEKRQISTFLFMVFNSSGQEASKVPKSAGMDAF